MAKSANPSNGAHPPSLGDETTPLLGASSVEPTALGSSGETVANNVNEGESEPPKKFRRNQILLLCLAAMVEPVGYFAIFPYVNQMVHDTGNVEQTSVGFWSGMIESIFSLVQMVLMIFYGRLADRLGRKPVLIFSLCGMGSALSIFGLSRNLWQMVLFRSIAGCFAGSSVTVRVMISENGDKEAQARSFSWYMFSRNLGIFVGPMFGGLLVKPAINIPSIFGHSKFFIDYPFALPSFATGLFTIIVAVICMLNLDETLKRESNDTGGNKSMSTLEVLRSPGVGMTLYIYGHCILLGLAFTAVGPLCLYTDIDKGGFSFSERMIAIYIIIGGASQSFWMLVAFPALQRKMGTGNLLRLCATFWPITMLMWPIMNEMRRHGYETLFWATGTPIYAMSSLVAMGFACVQLCINDVSPSANVLATVNALALSVASGIRAVAPFLFSSIFAAGVKTQFLDGHLAFLTIAALAAGLRIACRWLPEIAEGRPKPQTS